MQALWVKGFQGKTLTVRGPECLNQSPRVTLDKIRYFFSFTYAQMKAYCPHLYFMKTGHELNCCVFISRECITKQAWHETCSEGSNRLQSNGTPFYFTFRQSLDRNWICFCLHIYDSKKSQNISSVIAQTLMTKKHIMRYT